MSELRWILIGFGIVLQAGIYLWGRRGSRSVASDDAVVRVRPEHSVQSREPSMSRTETLLPPEAERSVPTPASGKVDEYTITAVRAASPRSSAARAGGSDTVAAPVRPVDARSTDDSRRGRVEPTLDSDPGLGSDMRDELPGEPRDDTVDLTQTAELPAGPEPAAAPTLSSSESPPVRRIER